MLLVLPLPSAVVGLVSTRHWCATRRKGHTSRIYWWAEAVVGHFGRRPSVVGGLGDHKACLQQSVKGDLSLHVVEPTETGSREGEGLDWTNLKKRHWAVYISSLSAVPRISLPAAWISLPVYGSSFSPLAHQSVHYHYRLLVTRNRPDMSPLVGYPGTVSNRERGSRVRCSEMPPFGVEC